MAKLNCSYDRLLVKVLYGVFVSAVFLPFCLSAVNNCPPCGSGKFCSKFLGMCVACKDYCLRGADCPSACTPIKPSLSTIAPTATGLTSSHSHTTSSSQSDATSFASAVGVQQSTNANIPSEGDITFSDNVKDDSELPAWLSVGLLITLGIIVLIVFFCRKYCKTLKMRSLCCFSNGDSGNRTSIRDTGMTIWMNPMPNQPAGCHQTTRTYTAVQVDDDQPGPSQPNSSIPSRPPMPNVEAPADPRNYTSFAPTTPGPTSIQIHDTSPSTSGVSAVVVQSASIHPQRKFETPQGACPSDQRSFPRRTPETHRRITDGTHEGHEISIGTSSFNPPNGTCEDNHSAHGD